MFSKRFALMLLTASLVGCASQGAKSGYATPFAACGDKPNCISTEESRADYKIERLTLTAPAGRAWAVIKEEAKKLPKAEVITENANYFHMVSRSKLMNFTDHIELKINKSDNTLSVKSASVTGYSDWGVNRARVEALYQVLRDRKIAR